jgi:hypothetical protein
VRKIYVLGMALLMAAMMALPANAAMWVGGEIGANFISSTDLKASGGGYSPALAGTVGFSVKYKDVAFQPAVIGGLTVGYDFVNAGFLGYAWPDWMKYFGFAVDFTYNRVIIRNQWRNVSGAAFLNGANVTSLVFPGGRGNLFPFSNTSNGDIPVVAFLFYGHYGFFPDSEIAVGRVHPYVGVGPAIAFTNLDLGPYGLGTRSSTNVALATEAGIRFIALPTVTIDVGFRYRYLAPSWSGSGTYSVATALGNVTLTNASLKASVDSVNSFSFLVRVAYHF